MSRTTKRRSRGGRSTPSAGGAARTPATGAAAESPARSAAGRPGRLRALRAVHPFPSLLLTALILALVPLADSGAAAWLYAVLGGGMLLYQFAIGLADDIADVESDAVRKPWKPIPAGVLSRRAAIVACAACILAGAAVTATLDGGTWLIGLAGLTCGLAYDLRLKGTVLSPAPFALAFPLVPAWVFSATGTWYATLWWAFPAGALLGAAIHFANQAPDAPPSGPTPGRKTPDAGRQQRGLAPGAEGLPGRIGERASRAVAIGLFGVAASIATVVLLFESATGAALSAATASVAGYMAPRAVRMFGRDGLFGVLASGAALLAVVFVAAS